MKMAANESEDANVFGGGDWPPHRRIPGGNVVDNCGYHLRLLLRPHCCHPIEIRPSYRYIWGFVTGRRDRGYHPHKPVR